MFHLSLALSQGEGTSVDWSYLICWSLFYYQQKYKKLVEQQHVLSLFNKFSVLGLVFHFASADLQFASADLSPVGCWPLVANPSRNDASKGLRKHNQSNNSQHIIYSRALCFSPKSVCWRSTSSSNFFFSSSLNCICCISLRSFWRWFSTLLFSI